MLPQNQQINFSQDNKVAFAARRNHGHFSRLLVGLSVASLVAIPSVALANQIDIKQPADARAQGLDSLRVAVKNDGGVPVPSNLKEFIKDRRAAVQLGKALFWDMQVGSDGVQACASCHFHAGADNRSMSQLNPNADMLLDAREDDVTGYFNASIVGDTHFELKGPNAKLKAEDFPLVKFIQSLDKHGDGTVSPAAGNSNDIVGSMGVFASTFDGIQLGSAQDSGTPLADPIFHTEDGKAVRQTVARNAPSVINAVFNFTNFWDGRANPIFNGNDHFGNQNPFAAIFVNGANGLEVVQIALDNASLASQTLGPPASTIEMSYGDPNSANRRDFMDIGRKLLEPGANGKPLMPLAKQQVHPFDSTLGRLSNYPQPGLKADYATLIKQAFADQYWNSTKLATRPDGVKLTQMEVNFSLFFGLAVQMYESTLIADRTPFDKWMETGKFNRNFGSEELAGLNLFVNQGGCVNCHAGPELTKASVRFAKAGSSAIRAMSMAQGTALYDAGFYNIGITPTTDDVGRGDRDPVLGQPLAFARQSLFQRLQNNQMGFPIFGDDTLPAVAEDSSQRVCSDANHDGFCGADEAITPEFQRVAVDGAFKTPGLRNVELTGPYFHNGGVATLRQVVQFYNRGGNFCSFNSKELDANIKPLNLTAQQEQQLVAFLVALTDPRVKYQTAPFDHPELHLPANGLDEDGHKRLEPVGAWGLLKALKTFLNLDPQDPIFTPEGVCTITP